MTLKLNGSTGGSVSIDAPAATTGNADITFSLPVADGSNGQVLQTNGSGQLSFGSGSQWTTSGSNIYYTTGSVSVGTSTALGHKVEIADALQADANLSYSLAIYGNNTAATGNSSQIFLGALNGGTNRGCAIASVITANANAHEMAFKVSGPSATPTERMRIDNSGRLLVGTSSTSVSSTAIFQSNPGIVRVTTNTSSPASGADLGYLAFGDNGHSSSAWINAQRDGGTWNSTSKPTRLIFSTSADGGSSPTERMRISQDGGFTFYNTPHLLPGANNATSIGNASWRWSTIYAVNGTINTSDERLKTEITEATLGTDFIKSLRPVSYKWIEGGKRHTGEYDEDNNWVYESVPGQRTHWGFIAQEVKQAVDDAGVDFGGWVLTDKDDPDSEQALRYDQFIAPLTKALQEALAEIESLKTRLTALEGGTN